MVLRIDGYHRRDLYQSPTGRGKWLPNVGYAAIYGNCPTWPTCVVPHSVRLKNNRFPPECCMRNRTWVHRWMRSMLRDSRYAGKLWVAVRLGVRSACDYMSERRSHDWSGRPNVASATTFEDTRKTILGAPCLSAKDGAISPCLMKLDDV